MALVLGTAPIGPEGGPNRYFVYRLDAAAALYKAGKVKYLIVSGDNAAADYDEPTAMRDGLIERGVPAEAIYRDFAGDRTLDSVAAGAADLRPDAHRSSSRSASISRARSSWRATQGIEAWGFEARDVDTPYSLFTELRRYPSALRAYCDVWFDTPPKYAGGAHRHRQGSAD